MRTGIKFVNEVYGYSLKNIRRLEVKFDPLHPNAPNVREFWSGITSFKRLKSNPEVVTKAKIVSDGSNPLVTVQFKDNHKLVIDGKYMESSHFVQVIKQFETIHQDEPKDI